jgi:hypothetical protein
MVSRCREGPFGRRRARREAAVTAFDAFCTTLNNIDTVKQGADEFAALLEQRCSEAEQALRDAEEVREIVQGAARVVDRVRLAPTARLIDRVVQQATDEVRDRSIDLTRVQNDWSVWRRDIPRRTAVAYCTAFETFLRALLVEQVAASRDILERILVKHLRKSVREVAGKIRSLQHLEDKLLAQLQVDVLFPGPLTVDTVDHCVEGICPSFQNVHENGGVRNLYKHVFAKDLFGEKAHLTRERFGSPEEEKVARDGLRNAYRDIRLLFLLRHQFVHRNGAGGAEYRSQMLGKKGALLDRLDEGLVQRYGATGAPAPDEILQSRPKSPSFGNKLEEFGDSLRRYAEYLVAECSVT